MRAAAALRFTENGHDVFRQLLKRAAGGLSQDIFRELAELGRSHVSRLRQMAEETVEMDEDSAHALRELTERAEAARGEMGALCLGVELKRRSCEFFARLSEAAENAFERRFYKDLADEERTSLLSLLQYHEFLSDPTAYFTATEHVTLDG
jgi:rubrerythrin